MELTMTSRLLIFSALFLLLTATRVPGAEPPSTRQADDAIWADAVMKQPFDKQPFRAVRIPAWLRQTAGAGYTMSVSTTEGRQRAAAAGVTLSELGFYGTTHCFYESQYLKRRHPEVTEEHVRKDIAEYRRLGIRVLAAVPPTLQGEIYEIHPEWRRVDTPSDEIPQVDLKQHPYGGMLCLLGPYGDYFIELLAEVLTKFPEVDAFSFDGLHYAGVCYCKHCRAAFRDEMGIEIPAVNMEDRRYRQYQHWADRRMEDVVRRMQRRLKTIKPDVALVTWTTNAGRWGHFLSIPRNMPARMNLLFDAPDQELWLDESNRGASIAPAFGCAYAWAVTNHRVAFSEPYLMSHGNPYSKDSFPADELNRRMMMVLTYGGAPSIAVAQPRLQQAVYHSLDQVRRLRPWLDKEPERWAALVVSDNTRNFYGRSAGHVEERYLANVLGLFRMAVEEHLPVTLINDWNLNDADLSNYKVLILANTASLDDDQMAAVGRFVNAGGGLVATADTSRFNEFGDLRGDFGLAPLLGVSLVNDAAAPTSEPRRESIDANFAMSLPAEYWDKRKNVYSLKLHDDARLWSARLRDDMGTGRVTFKGHANVVKTVRETARVVATLNLPDAVTEMPAAVTNQVGNGRAAYLAASVDAAHYLYSYPYQRKLLRDVVVWSAGEVPPVTVEAPMSVHATFFRQKVEGRQRLLVHLFNDTNSTANHAFPNDAVPLREEVIPIHDVRVRLGSGYRSPSAFEEPAHHPLEMKREGGFVWITLPRLQVHSLIVIDLAN
jgi:hypothetical protein